MIIMNKERNDLIEFIFVIKKLIGWEFFLFDLLKCFIKERFYNRNLKFVMYIDCLVGEKFFVISYILL